MFDIAKNGKVNSFSLLSFANPYTFVVLKLDTSPLFELQDSDSSNDAITKEGVTQTPESDDGVVVNPPENNEPDDGVVVNPPEKPEVSETPSTDRKTLALLAKAPVASIDIKLGIDFTLSRSLGGKFNVTVYQNPPAKIEIKGLYNIKDKLSLLSILNFYTKYSKFKSEKGKMPTLILTVGTVSYKGFVSRLQKIGTSAIAGSTLKIPCVFGYILTFYGCRISKSKA